jgi:hypothetical protein
MQVIRPAMVFRGDWVFGAAYSYNDIVTYGGTLWIYYNNTVMNSSEDTPDEDTLYWKPFTTLPE